MNKTDIFIKLKEIFATVFKDSKLELTEKTTASDVDKWDSLNHVVLFNTIEKSFNIQFEFDDMLELNSVGDICDNIFEKLN